MQGLGEVVLEALDVRFCEGVQELVDLAVRQYCQWHRRVPLDVNTVGRRMVLI